MYPYSISEFTAEVMEQLKGFVLPGDKVEFEIKAYNADGYYIIKELNEKGICVSCGLSDIQKDGPNIKYTVIMK